MKGYFDGQSRYKVPRFQAQSLKTDLPERLRVGAIDNANVEQGL